ncbi:MAG TPA: hypothetical protein VJT33_01070, partial [bacterium]|nr:hypothetical protein [bacterium]
QRLLASNVLTTAQRQALTAQYYDLNPVALRTELQDRLQRLWRLADGPTAGNTKTGPTLASR